MFDLEMKKPIALGSRKLWQKKACVQSVIDEGAVFFHNVLMVVKKTQKLGKLIRVDEIRGC